MIGPSLIVRFAETAEDRDAIYRLRYQIYVEELGRQEPTADHARRMMPDAPGRYERLLLAEQGGRVIGTLRLDWGGDGIFAVADRAAFQLEALERVLTPDQIVIFSRFMLDPENRGTAAPRLLMHELMRFVVAHGVRAVLCDCRPPLINTYQQLGFRPYGQLVNAPGVGVLVPLMLSVDDREHLRAVQSSVLPLLDDVQPDPAVASRLRALFPSPPVSTLERPTEELLWPTLLGVLTTASAERFPIFSGLSAGDVARLVTMSNVIHCGEGDVIIRHGVMDGMMFVVLEGAVEVRREGSTVARLQAGSIFGEIGLLINAPRSADVVACGDTRLISLRQTAVSRLVAEEPAIAAVVLHNLARILARRLADSGAAQHDGG